eukprot:698489-Pleurochrysis_carterae.AAC.1
MEVRVPAVYQRVPAVLIDGTRATPMRTKGQARTDACTNAQIDPSTHACSPRRLHVHTQDHAYDQLNSKPTIKAPASGREQGPIKRERADARLRAQNGSSKEDGPGT